MNERTCAGLILPSPRRTPGTKVFNGFATSLVEELQLFTRFQINRTPLFNIYL